MDEKLYKVSTHDYKFNTDETIHVYAYNMDQAILEAKYTMRPSERITDVREAK